MLQFIDSTGAADEINDADIEAFFGTGPGSVATAETAMKAADVVDLSAKPFDSFAGANEYARKVFNASKARTAAFATALSTIDTAVADTLIYNAETGKVTKLLSSDAATAAAVTAANAANVIDLDALATATGGSATAATEAAARLVTLYDAITALNAFEGAVDDVLAYQPDTIATDAILSDTLITSRLRLNIAASTESDSGVTFGMSVRVQQDEGNTNSFNAARFYAKSGGLELAVGNIYGAVDSMPGLYSGTVGLTGLGYANVVTNFASLGYSSGGAGSAGTKEAAEIIYSMGDYGVHVATDGTDTEYAVSATVSGWTVALGGSDTDTATNAEWVATVGGKIGGASIGLATAEAVNGNSSTTLSASFDVAAATSVTVYYNDDEANTVDDTSYGLGFSHGLGGGTSLVGGIASVNDQTIADFGVLFNF